MSTLLFLYILLFWFVKPLPDTVKSRMSTVLQIFLDALSIWYKNIRVLLGIYLFKLKLLKESELHKQFLQNYLMKCKLYYIWANAPIFFL
jgi:hypothetical protein